MYRVVGRPITVFCTGPAPPETVVAAQLMCQKENHRITYKSRTGRRKKDSLIFNAKAYIVGNNSINGVPVSQRRVQIFLKSLQEQLKQNAEFVISQSTIYRCTKFPFYHQHHLYTTAIPPIDLDDTKQVSMRLQGSMLQDGYVAMY
ncbi:hypothetical protein L916_01697 [Phytophthora nicotianae]|uniref:Uncharacterized protein n=1 Tax=Phytophthora nicotianae TaxID=4792 RepID=W2JQP1_PHYNI|nr:hypothetical protein L916_01697 [Phytophthora nicotianae]